MNKTKNTGITLVALVITVIILLILAGISIASLTGSGLFERAKLAEEKSKNAQEKEEGILDDYENKIGKYINNNRDTNKDEFVATTSEISLAINSIQKVTTTKSLTWQISEGNSVEISEEDGSVTIKGVSAGVSTVEGKNENGTTVSKYIITVVPEGRGEPIVKTGSFKCNNNATVSVDTGLDEILDVMVKYNSTNFSDLSASAIYFNGIYATHGSNNGCKFTIENGILRVIGNNTNTLTYYYQARGYID